MERGRRVDGSALRAPRRGCRVFLGWAAHGQICLWAESGVRFLQGFLLWACRIAPYGKFFKGKQNMHLSP
jgi:hypothetical protein